jgi:hypothetical protein
MKKNTVFLSLTLVLAIGGLFVSGCKKSNSGGAGPAGINASFGGTAWQSQTAMGVDPSNDSFIYLTGYFISPSKDTSWVEIDVSDTAHINQPDVDYASSTIYYTTGSHKIYSSDPFFYSHGSMTVTSWDKTAHTITGTFNGVFYNTQVGNDSVIVTNGRFNTNYIVE